MACKMDSKDRVKCYLDLSSQSLDKFFKRREFEWKFNIVLWTPIAIVIGLALQGDIQSDIFTKYFWWITILHAVVLGLYIYWSMGLHSANRMDRKMSDDIIEALIAYVTDTSSDPKLTKVSISARRWLIPLRGWSSAVQIAMTFSLLLISWLVLCFPSSLQG